MNLILKAVVPAEYVAFHALQNDPLVSRMSGTIPYPIDMAFVTNRLKARAENERTEATVIERGVYKDGSLVGGGTLFIPQTGGWEIGYFIGAAYRSKGYATATAAALVKLLRQRGYFGPIDAQNAKDNPVSGRILEKLGFIRTGETTAKSAGRAEPNIVYCWMLPAAEDKHPLLLRPMAAGDYDALYDVQNDAEAARIAGGGGQESRAVFAARMQAILNGDQRECALRVVVVKGKIAGYLAYFRRAGKNREVSIWFGRIYWDQGLATRAMHLFLDRMPKDIKVEPLFARVVDGNDASIRVLEKNGFIAVARDKFYSDVRGCDVSETLFKR